ncbi:hypothetical protein [Mitsuaria sp. GD03876]|uniref:hypothetical protein n=1 Tax=Mitsuaria sp. GD03876 TaxID=2975399 RepID=UPI00244C01CB|nr:hypothetical protein [Mitsuaria sp. GD03876]MDH0863541.1 hypothetical protein [Mitsuaria sp. GD03876]
MNFKRIATAAVASLALVASTAHANYSCGGPVTYLGIDMLGDVTVSIGSYPIHKICNFNGTNGRASAATCKSVYATLLTARATGKTAAIYYDENGYTCSTLPGWQFVPSVYFVQGPDN